MGRIDRNVHLSYQDVLLVPYDDDFCSVMSRKDPDISTFICPGKKLEVPLVSSPMDSITEKEMAVAMNNCGALGVITRYINDANELQKQISQVKYVKQHSTKGYVAAAVGVKNNAYEHVAALCDAGLNIVCFDIANGNHVMMRDAIRSVLSLKDRYNLSIIAGNVATGKSAVRLAECGADSIKCGVGSGAICSTRLVTGMGVPQFTALLDVSQALFKSGGACIIADGGVRLSSDVSKAIWAGADTVMSGFIFAGCQECPSIDGKRIYRGMASRVVSGRTDVASEGVSMTVPQKGSVVDAVSEYTAALRATCSMGNAMNLQELRKNVRAIRVSTMSHNESGITQVS